MLDGVRSQRVLIPHGASHRDVVKAAKLHGLRERRAPGSPTPVRTCASDPTLTCVATTLAPPCQNRVFVFLFFCFGADSGPLSSCHE